VQFTLRYDIRAPDFGAQQADLFEACLEQCEWADKLGFQSVGVLEHHGSEDGYNPSPFVLAAAIAARTERIKIRLTALILPLHDPIRVAEDAAVVDQISRGRLELVIGAGYVRREFDMFGKDLADRVRSQTEGVEVLQKAWTGEPFEYHGSTITVTPRPFQRPRPRLVLGGSSPGAARRAARIADGFEATMPEFEEIYRDECARLGVPASPPRPPGLPAMFVFIAEDPDAAWEKIAPHALHETNSYGKWLAEAGTPAPYNSVADAEALRASGAYLVMTPREFTSTAVGLGSDAVLIFHPLMGGLDPALSWSSLRLFEEQVLPKLRAEGLVAKSD
jgi:alkanesulfonate monooxygenase SsuD/methylene tetrahydromethanopterin reductase-like flavin-dependent oxidoreductase (luciferase family)